MSFNPLADRSKQDYRRLSNRLLKLADEGRMTLEMLKDISDHLTDTLFCDAVEIAYKEKDKLFHCDSRKGETPAFFCSVYKEKGSLESRILKHLRLLKKDLPISDLFLPIPEKNAKQTPRMHLLWTAPEPSSHTIQASPALHTIVILPLAVGTEPRGLLIFGYEARCVIDSEALEHLEDVALNIGVSLSHNQAHFDLRERVKELSCMYGIANLATQSNGGIKHILTKVASLLPPAYLYPSITEARILLDGSIFSTPGFATSEFIQAADIVVNDNVRGRIEVVYLESRPNLDEGPFLDEERHLINSVARELALLIERKQSEKEQARLEEQLRHADRLATIGQLAAGVAHELNEPLTGILGFAELLSEIHDMPEQAGSDIRRIQSASLHAREVVRKLLLFAKQIPPKQAMVDVNRIIKDVVSFLNIRTQKAEVEVHCDLKETIDTITADESQIRQVIVNLVINAVHAMPEGGKLYISTTQTEGNIHISFQDTGVGIPEKLLDRIFLPFVTSKDVDKGTGLGLSVVHGIVKAHKGTIKVDSDYGVGSKFTVSLPITVKKNDQTKQEN